MVETGREAPRPVPTLRAAHTLQHAAGLHPHREAPAVTRRGRDPGGRGSSPGVAPRLAGRVPEAVAEPGGAARVGSRAGLSHLL